MAEKFIDIIFYGRVRGICDMEGFQVNETHFTNLNETFRFYEETFIRKKYYDKNNARFIFLHISESEQAELESKINNWRKQ